MEMAHEVPEISRLGNAVGWRRDTFAGLAAWAI
jgi:hypothetical protein